MIVRCSKEERKMKHKNLSCLVLGKLAMAFAVLGVLMLPTQASAVSYRNHPGIVCMPKSETQLGSLTYNQFRVFNTSSTFLWVYCPLLRSPRAVSDRKSAIHLWVNLYFGSLYLGTDGHIKCVWREMRWGTTGGVLRSKSRFSGIPTAVPTVIGVKIKLRSYSSNDFLFWTLACRLPPMTGINSIDLNGEPN
jgi:hypothetical protein